MSFWLFVQKLFERFYLDLFFYWQLSLVQRMCHSWSEVRTGPIGKALYNTLFFTHGAGSLAFPALSLYLLLKEYYDPIVSIR